MKGTAMDVTEHRIRERAYLLWEAEGRPEGREIEYWERAQHLIGTGEAIRTAENGHEHSDRGLNGGTGSGKKARAEIASPEPVAKAGGKRDNAGSAQTKPAKRKGSRSK